MLIATGSLFLWYAGTGAFAYMLFIFQQPFEKKKFLL